MQVILLERIERLGQMGEVVTVRPGYARNFLLPRKKALRATQDNVTYFEGQKKVLEADNLKKKAEAGKVAQKMEGLKAVLIRQASEAGQLYGSVTARDISDAITEKGFKTGKDQVRLDRAYKTLGLFPVRVVLHPEVSVDVTINIARSAEEAQIQEERGEALISKAEEPEAAPEAPVEAAPAAAEAPAEAEAEA